MILFIFKHIIVSFSGATKTMVEVDFTPLFLALLPLFLVAGTLLGLGLQGTSSSTTPNITVNVNASTSTAGTTSTSTATNTTTIVPLVIYTNGTYSFPFLSGGLTLSGLSTSILGLGSLFNFFPFFGLGRSFSDSFWSIEWPDIDQLFQLYFDLNPLMNDDGGWILCRSQEQSRHSQENVILFLLR